MLETNNNLPTGPAIGPADLGSKPSRRTRIASFLFWSWNVIFVAFMVLGFAPRLLPEIITATTTGVIPVSFLFYGLVLALIPLLSVVLGLTVLRGQPNRLFAMAYVVEGPLMLMLGIRFFIIRQANPGLLALMTIASIGMAAFLWQVLDRRIDQRGTAVQWMRLGGLCFILLLSIYIAVWLLFYSLPAATLALRSLAEILMDLGKFFQDIWRSIVDVFRDNLLWVPFTILGFILYTFTAILVVLTPIAVPILVVRAWLASYKERVQKAGWLAAAGYTVLVSAIIITGFILANRQPQSDAFALLEEKPQSREAARLLVAKENQIRSGLLNAYLASFRYIGAVGEVDHISTIYLETFHISSQSAQLAQDLYEQIARPLLYVPVEKSPQSLLSAMSVEPEQAARLYRRFFDEPIIEGEHDTIVDAVRSTWSFDQAEAAWREVDHREVHLERQEITVSEQGDWAEIEIFEVYKNQTGSNQEVIYFFNLPESSVITGLWLGNSPNRDNRFVYQVAPRGAAQAVYREQTRVQRDPALVEQIGPRQYRLRAFPIPAMVTNYDPDTDLPSTQEAKPLYLWLTYRTLPQAKAWPLPVLADRRNIYWDKKTERLVNGEPAKMVSDTWLPASLPLESETAPQVHRANFANGTSLVAVPAAREDLPALPSTINLAVVVDRSRSMQAHSGEVAQALASLNQLAGESHVDVYLTASTIYGEAPSKTSGELVKPLQLEYFGGQHPSELLLQFNRLNTGKAYDAVLVLTDGSGYELGGSMGTIDIPEAPVWMIHLGSNIPLGYDDETLQAIQASGGGVVGSLDEALQRIAVHLGSASGAMDLVDGYAWHVLPTAKASLSYPDAILDSEGGFSSLAARFAILAEMRRQGGELRDLAVLDQLHALAQQYSIVTPYSSMIVLVDSTQQKLLDNLELLDDRYTRETEKVGQTTPATQVPLTGVPEPHEWLLIGAAVILLMWYANQRRLASNQQSV